MGKMKNFGEVEKVAVTVLVDNRADRIVKSTDTVEYFTDQYLLAEHGFSVLVDLKSVGVRILWDAAATRIALMENMKRMGIDPATIDKIALSHGHSDHTAGVTDVLMAMDIKPKAKQWESDASIEEMRRWVEGWRVPVVIHPGAFRDRWRVKEDGSRYGPILPPPRDEWEAAGAEIVLSEGAYRLECGCWTTGMVPHLSFEKSGRPSWMVYRQGDEFRPDDIEEDQAIVIHVKGKGLVVLSGCAHSGIVNTVEYARDISGVNEVWAVLGGFHLARSSDEEILRTVDAIKSFQPKLVAPSHCTGFRAIREFAVQMPEAFVLGQVGATYSF